MVYKKVPRQNVRKSNQSKRQNKKITRSNRVIEFIKKQRKLSSIIFVLLFAGIGTYLLISTRAATVYTVPASIDATGSQDVTSQLNAFFDSVSNGSSAGSMNVIAFPTQGKFRIEGTLYLKDRNNLIFDGNGSQIFASTDGYEIACPAWTTSVSCNNWPRNRMQWSVVGGANLIFKNMHVKGSHPNGGNGGTYKPELEAQHGFDFAGTSNTKIDSVVITDVWGDFVHASSDPRFIGVNEKTNTRTGEVWTTDLVIVNSRMERNGRQGIALTAAENVLIKNNYIGNTRRSTFDLEPDTANRGAVNVLIENNQIGPGQLRFIANEGADGPIEHIYVLNNKLDRSLSFNSIPRSDVVSDTTRTYKRGPFYIVGNTSTVMAEPCYTSACLSDQTAVYSMYMVKGFVFKNNKLPVKPHSSGNIAPLISLVKSEDFVIEDNVASGTSKIYKTDTESRNYAEKNNILQSITDSLSPTTSNILAPTIGATVSGVMTLRAEANDNHAIQKVELLANDIIIGTAYRLNKFGDQNPIEIVWDSKTVADGSYNIIAKSYDITGLSKTSSPVSVTVTNQVSTNPPPVNDNPEPITFDLSGHISSPAKIELKWVAAPGTIVNYRIFKSINGGGYNYTGSPVPGEIQTFSDENVSLGNSYGYFVRSYDADGRTTDSKRILLVIENNDQPTAGTDTEPPSPPNNLKVGSSNRKAVQLSWTSSSDNVGVSGYYVMRSDSTTPIAFITDTSYTDTYVRPNRTYTYHVIAVDTSDNSSSKSNTVTTKTK